MNRNTSSYVYSNEGPCHRTPPLPKLDPLGLQTPADGQRDGFSSMTNSNKIHHQACQDLNIPALLGSDKGGTTTSNQRQEFFSNRQEFLSSYYRDCMLSAEPLPLQLPMTKHSGAPPPTRSNENVVEDSSNSAALPEKVIEITPGVHMRVVGVAETRKAVENDYYVPASCFCCSNTIFCIRNADFILCPDCRVVSPLEGSPCNTDPAVGLGFSYEELSRWQQDILISRKKVAPLEELLPRSRAGSAA